jgi:IclR family KDG regulon transcriptional repressor
MKTLDDTATEVTPTDNVATVASVSRALAILRCFTPSRTVLGVSEVARMLEMHKSTTYRLLVTLEREQFLYQVEPGRYALSYTVLELATAVSGSGGIREVVLEQLGELVAQTGETAHLAVLDDGEVLYLEKVEGTWSLRMPSAVGRKVPINCTALGKVLLSGLAPDKLKEAARSRKWEAVTPHTVTDPKKLESIARRVGEEGFAVDREEIELGLLCIAAPIRDDVGEICAGISISGPISRIDPHLPTYVSHVKAAADAISSRLGAQARTLREVAFGQA